MTNHHANAALNQLLTIESRSLPMYLAGADPWLHPGDDRPKQLLDRIVADQQLYARRIADLLMNRRALSGFGEFPMVFTDTHDLSLDYLISEITYYQKQDIASIQHCVTASARDSEARTLAEEVLGNARGHLESLEELLAANAKR